jgi:glycerophosphoryl diester phosphodiesterase
MVTIVGHRGAAGLAPENTVVAFRRAYELGARTLELDVRLTADGVPVVIHDATVDRTTNGSGRVGDLRLVGIQALDAGRRFGIPARVPTLAEALGSVPDDTRWFIELKQDEAPPEVAAAEVLRILDGRVGQGRCRLISFSEPLLAAVRGCGTGYRLGVLAARDLDEALDAAAQLDCEAIMLEMGMISEEAVGRCHARRLRLSAWTANSAERVKELARLGVDEITTDYPDLALRALAGTH